MSSTQPRRDALHGGGAVGSAEQLQPEQKAVEAAGALGVLTAAVGGIMMVGWIWDIPIMRSLLPDQVEAKANTAVGFILAGVALALKTGGRDRRKEWTSNGCAALVALIGLLTLGEYAFGWNLGIDELLFRDVSGSPFTVHPGRMALPTALNFVLLGIALIVLRIDRRRTAIGWLVIPPAILATLAFMGQLYGFPYLLSYGPFTPIAAPTGAAFMVLCAGILLAASAQFSLRMRQSGGMIGFVLAIGLLVLMGGAVFRNTKALVQHTTSVTHTHEVLDAVAGILLAMQDLETGARGYLLTGDNSFLEPYRTAPLRARRSLREVRYLTLDNTLQEERLSRLTILVEEKIFAVEVQVAQRQQGDPGGAQLLLATGQGKRVMDSIRETVAELQGEERRLLQVRQDRLEAVTLRTMLTLVIGLIVAVGLLLAVFMVLRREILRRRQSETALRRSEESLAVTLNSIGDAVMATDTAGRITLLNPVAEQLMGWRSAEAQGRPVAEVFRIINEQTRLPAPIPVAEVLETGEIRGLSNHTALIARDGTERSIADSAAPIRDAAGRILGVVMVFRDVTEEYATRKALRESEARYRTLFESIDQGFCLIQMIYDEAGKPADYRFLEINPAFVTQTGMADALGKRMRELAPQHEAHWFETYGRIARTGEPIRFQNRAEQLGRTFDVYAFRFGDAQNQQVAILFNDITERNKAKAELDHFFNLSLDFLCIAGLDGYFRRVSPTVTEILGWSVDEFIAMPYMEQIHPDDQESARREVERQSAGHKVMNYECRFRHKDGTWRLLSWRSTPYQGMMYATARDVTQARRDEAKIRQLNKDLQEHASQLAAANACLEHSRAELNSLFESLPGLYLIMRPDFTIVTASDAYLTATLTTRETIVGRGLFEVFPDNPNDPAADGVRNLRASLERVLESKASDTMAIQKYDIRRADGTFEERYWSPINSPLLGLDRQLIYIIHRVEDVTAFIKQRQAGAGGESELRARLEQMQAEVFQSSRMVQVTNHRLAAANKELEAFSYSVSHDLRAPLRHIHGYVEMLTHEAEAQLSEKARRYLRTIATAAGEMGQLIDDLLAFSRMGRAEMQEAAVDLTSLVAHTRQGLERTTAGRNVVWTVAPLPPVQGDLAMLRQVLVNLLGNAVKYTRTRDPAVIEIGCAGEEEGRIIFYVRDNGAGFDMKYADKLFGVFQRLHRSDEFEGTGIGLASVRRIIARHGGRTWAEGQVGAGATIFFTLAPAPAARPLADILS